MQLEETTVLNSSLQNRNLTIKIQGLALSYFDKNTTQWKIFFPKVKKHIFKLIIKKSIDDIRFTESSFIFPNEKDRNGSEITITPDAITKSVAYDSQVEEILDLSKLHNEEIYLKAETNDPQKDKLYIGFLTLNGTVLLSEYSTKKTKVKVWQTTPGGENPTNKILVKTPEGKNIWELAEGFSSGFEIAVNQTTVIDLQKVFGFDLTLDFSDPKVSYEVTFSNDCEGDGCEAVSDFKYYYNIIDENLLKDKKRFELIVEESGGRRRIAGCAGKTASNLNLSNLETP